MNDAQPDRHLAIGDTLHGYCGGYFGRDHYDCCTIEAIGPDWLVARDADDCLSFAAGRNTLAALRAYRQPTTDVNGDPCCKPLAPAITVRYVPACRPACRDCGQVWHSDYTCGEFAQQRAALAAAIDRLLPAALDYGNPDIATRQPNG